MHNLCKTQRARVNGIGREFLLCHVVKHSDLALKTNTARGHAKVIATEMFMLHW